MSCALKDRRLSSSPRPARSIRHVFARMGRYADHEGSSTGARPTLSVRDESLKNHYLCSLVIPTKNGGDLFKDVVRELQAQTCWGAVEFIVVDSGSSDDTVATARSAGARCVSIQPADFNHGATRDFGISLASCNRIALMVQDAVPNDSHMIEKLVAALDEDNVAGVYARQIPRPTADVITKRNLNLHFTGRLKRDMQIINSSDEYAAMSPDAKYAICNFDNVCSALRKDVWQIERFGRVSFGEDINWAERVLKRGYKIIYEPAAAVVHSHDRPLAYEYARTYICHRTLYRQFGLEQVPTLRVAFRAWISGIFKDIAVIVRDEKNVATMVKMMLRAPLMNFLLIRAKYEAERHEKLGLERPTHGV